MHSMILVLKEINLLPEDVLDWDLDVPKYTSENQEKIALAMCLGLRFHTVIGIPIATLVRICNPIRPKELSRNRHPHPHQ
jgi:hypothetical protein